MQPPYGYLARLEGVSYDTAKARIVEALKTEGFGVLTEIDVKETFKKKLGKDFRHYVILGACNPDLAYQAFAAEMPVGLLLPCNVCVWEEAGGSTVAILRPDKMMETAANPALAPVAAEADARLRRALDHVRSQKETRP